MAAEISDIITWAKQSQFLASKDLAISTAISGGKLDRRLPQLLRMERMSLEWAYAQNPNASSLVKTGAYVLSLCGKYLFEAKQLSGVGSIATPSTSVLAAAGFIIKEAKFIVGAGSTMVAGATLFTITDSNIVSGSISVHADGVQLYPNLSDRLSYSVSYGSGSATVTFNQQVSEGQAIMYEYRKATSSAGSSSSGGSGTTYTLFEYEANGAEGLTISSPDLVGVTIYALRRNSVDMTANPTSVTDPNRIFEHDSAAGTIAFQTELAEGEYLKADLI